MPSSGRTTVRPAIDTVQVLLDQLLVPLGGLDDRRTEDFKRTLALLLDTPLGPARESR